MASGRGDGEVLITRGLIAGAEDVECARAIGHSRSGERDARADSSGRSNPRRSTLVVGRAQRKSRQVTFAGLSRLVANPVKHIETFERRAAR